MGVGVVEAGHREGTVEVDDLGFRALELEDFGIGARREDFSVGDGEGSDLCRGGRGVVGTEVGAGEDIAVDQDCVGGFLRGGADG